MNQITDHATKLRSIAKIDDREPWDYRDVLAAADELDRLRELLNACWDARYNADAIDALLKGSGIHG